VNIDRNTLFMSFTVLKLKKKCFGIYVNWICSYSLEECKNIYITE